MELNRDQQQEWTRRILACPHAPRTPVRPPAEGRYRDENAILWSWENGVWSFVFKDAATRNGLIERLRNARLETCASPKPLFVGRWGAYATPPSEHPGEIIAWLYEAHMHGYVSPVADFRGLP